jgi:hypothetical protein
VSRRLAVLQSNYLPWRGYFDIIGCADDFVVYDIVQFTKNDWRNRNRIRTADGVRWLTIPIRTAGRFGQTVAEAQVVNEAWASSHWRSIAQAYARAPFFPEYRAVFEQALTSAAALTHLSQINRLLIETVCRVLGVTTVIRDARQFELPEGRNERLIALCRATGADIYVSGPSAQAYLDVSLFAASGVRIEFIDYSAYAPYPQVHGDPFEPSVSVLDLLFNTGPGAAGHLQFAQRGSR